jgi:predicted phosphodiesterase
VRFLVISDTHANWHAVESVLRDADGEFEQIICCGDLVGYNAFPARVLEWTRANCATVIRGNHDKVVAGLEDLEWFNEVAQTAARWSMEQLDPEQMDYLHQLPIGPAHLEHFDIWHGSPQDEDEYISTAGEAVPCFAHFDVPLGFFGHTHLQGGFFAKAGRTGSIQALRRQESEAMLELDPDVVYMVNPGSVGQPRDGDPRSAYAIFDSDARTVLYRRVEYPIAKAAKAIQDAGLPDVLAFRLFQGL